MAFCNHGAVTVDVGAYGDACVTWADRTAAFPRTWLAENEWVTVEGDRITVCGTTVYEVIDWHHRCPGYGPELALSRLISRPPQHGDLETLLNDRMISEPLGNAHG
ncbi:hypothetical protein ACIBQX_11450 [Nonomuraea sp. NPDC049714]|uniref:hypothetical protein n=1 Tax=Nonomuraea sp. NPDC049714 TaxID=3364357 RepID=UPI00378DE48C